MAILESPAAKFLVSMALLAALAPLVVRVFRRTWIELDTDASSYRRALADAGQFDARTIATLVLGSLTLIFINYFGNGDTFNESVLPALRALQDRHPGLVDVQKYEDLYWRSFWGISRYAYHLMPLVVWCFLFPRDRLLDFGLRGRGFLEHLWLYLLFVAIMVPTLVIVARASDFGTYYPMYKTAGRSWMDFALWEVIYVGQFFTLELFFRGFLLRGARGLGSGAIFAMVVPYAMIHFSKPYFEACGAIVAGTVLGSLSMKTRSIYAGFLLHATVAVLMDLLALQRRGALPVRLTPDSQARFEFAHLNVVLWIVWLAAVGGLAYILWRRRAASRGARR